jgi:sugar (pentulose or hexulose) kinase
MAIEVIIGLDLGTKGVRALATDEHGDLLAAAEVPIADKDVDEALHEQDPHEWWQGVCQALKSVGEELDKADSSRFIRGIAVTSTSGTLVLSDAHGQPVRPAVLYDDARGALISEDLNRRLPPSEAHFNSSYSLVKAVWVRQREPAIWDRVRRVQHPTDWLTGRLTGCHTATDYCNALKLGYDVEQASWSGAVSLLELPSELLPKVFPPGAKLGDVSAQASCETRLPSGTPVFAGATDGMASLIASGACRPGDSNTTLGTTMVWKVLSGSRPRPGAGMYCHRHPAGLWAPGAASNTGPGSLHTERNTPPSCDLDWEMAEHLPSPRLCYMLPGKGERFPFVNSTAETFFEGKLAGPAESYAAQLQSLAFVERWGYERLREHGVPEGDVTYSTGSAAVSPVLSQLRADVLGMRVARCRYPTSAFGAAIIAASSVAYGGDLAAAIRGMTRVSESYESKPDARRQFEEVYNLFRSACAKRGYV